MKVAFLFPGQGSQEVGMGAAFAAASPAARAVYDNASAAVGFDVAERRLRPALEAATFHDPVTPFFSTVTTRVEEHGADLAEILVQQLTAPVRFTQAVEELVRRGVTQFVEIGSGNVLSGLVRRIDRSVQAIAVSNPDGLQKLEAARV